MTEFVKKGLLSSKKTLLDKFGAMQTKGKLDVGQYESIKKVAELSENIDIYNLIEEREAEIIEALKREKTGQKSDKSVSTKLKGSEVSSAKKRKLEEETDQSDPLYGRDDRGRGFYDTAGKRGYLLILNNTHRRLGTGNDVSNLQSFFGDILGYRVDTKSNDLSRADVIRALQSARDNIRSGATHEYFPFICAILSHGDENGLSFTDGAIKVNEISKIFKDKIEEHNLRRNKLSGRPKLFFIESCRGGKAQRLHEVDDADDIVPQRNVDMADEIIYIPSDANTLLAYSSTKGHASYRDRSRSNTAHTYFIKALIDVFTEYYRTDHVEDMLISVKERVALEQDVTLDTDHNIYTRQMPCTQSTLTKRLYLTPYNGQ